MPLLSASISIEGTNTESLEKYLQIYHDAGFRQWQAFWRTETRINADKLTDVANRYDGHFDSVHGRFGNHLDPSSPYDAKRQYTIETAEKDAEFACALGASIIIIHPSCKIPKEAGLDVSNRSSWGSAVEADREPLLMQSMEELAGIGEELEVIFAIENVPGRLWFGCDSAQMAEMIRRVDSPFIRMCFDTGHAHVEAKHYGDCAEQLARCLDVVSYFHIHDNDGNHDSHEAPGDGTINWNYLSMVMRDADPNSIVMLEMFRKSEEMKEILKRPFVHEILQDLTNQ